MPWEIALIVTSALLVAVLGLGFLLPKYRKRSVQGEQFTHENTSEHPDTALNFVLFSSDYCANCPAVRRVLTELDDEYPQISWSEVNLSHNLELAKHYQIMRTPAVFVLNSNRDILTRFSGAVAKSAFVAEIQTQLNLHPVEENHVQ